MKKTFHILKMIKLIAVVVLVFSIFLPFSSCTKLHEESEFVNVPEQDRPPKVVKPSVVDPKTGLQDGPDKIYYKVTTTTYVLRDFNLSDMDSWILVFCYIWPLGLLGLSLKLQRMVLKVVNWSVESVISLFALYFIFSESLFGPELGAYISFYSNLTVFMIWATESGLMIYLKKKYKSLSTACLETGVTLPIHRGW